MKPKQSEKNIIQIIEDIRSRLEINRYDLGTECVKQPAFFAEVAFKVPELKKEMLKAKAEFERTKADLEIQIRKDPADFNLSDIKITDKVVTAAVPIQEKYQQTQAAYFDAMEIYSQFQSVVDAVEDRKTMIRDLVTLWEKDYYQEKGMEQMNTSKGKVADAQADNLEKFRAERRNRRREQRGKEGKKND